MKPKANPTKFSYDKTRRTIVAPEGTLEARYIEALANIRRLRSAMRRAAATLNEVLDAPVPNRLSEEGK